MTPDAAQRAYADLLAQRRAGRLSAADFAQAVAQLRGQDATGRWWQIDPASGQWLTWDGAAWVASAAPTRPAARAGPTRCPRCQRPARAGLAFCPACGAPVVGGAPPPPSAAQRPPPTQRGQRFWDTVTLLGCAATAAAWFLYSGMAETQPDYKTCLTIVGLPLALMLFRAPLDRLLRPLRPLRARVPRLVLLGVGLAIPLLMANLLYRSGSSQFEFMFRTVLASTLLSYLTLRDPGPDPASHLSGRAGR